MNKSPQYIIYIILLNLLISSCVEPITIETETFDDLIVIEALITNEFKHHQISLTKTYGLDQNVAQALRNASVRIVDSEQNTYTFTEESPGGYVSHLEFEAIPNRSYQLLITTSEGKEYQSNQSVLPSETQIESVTINTGLNEDDILGVSINANSFDPNGESKYYRYEYEETYKIIAPRWSPYNSIIVTQDSVDLEERTKEEKTCYKTLHSTDIIQTQTTGLEEDRVTQKLVRFIPANDFIISHRYSILVKQYIQSLEAYTYFKTLKELSGSESVLSQNQPGFLTGNIIATDNPNEKVIGYFDVSSVSTKRIFFNFRDAFPDVQIPGPPYFIECELFAPLIDNSDDSLINIIANGTLKFYLINSCCPMEPPIVPGGGPHVMVIPECGDCTTVGSNVVPDFWVE